MNVLYGPALRRRVHGPDPIRYRRRRGPHFSLGPRANRVGNFGSPVDRNGDGGGIGWNGGAALRRSPASASAAGVHDAPFKYPEVRSWLSFSTERLYSRSLALVSGIGASSECAPLTPAVLRPLGGQALPTGHFHAAAFSYRPLKKGNIDLNATVTTLFETETLQGVLHLLSDTREAAGPQQSEFIRARAGSPPRRRSDERKRA